MITIQEGCWSIQVTDYVRKAMECIQTERTYLKSRVAELMNAGMFSAAHKITSTMAHMDLDIYDAMKTILSTRDKYEAAAKSAYYMNVTTTHEVSDEV